MNSQKGAAQTLVKGKGLSSVLGNLQTKQGPCEECGAVPSRQRFNVPDSEQFVEVDVLPCDCAEKKEEERRRREHHESLIRAADIPERFRGLQISSFRVTDENRDQFDSTVKFVRELDENVRTGKGFMMLGSPGTGKTSCACWILERAIEKEIQCRYLSYRNFVIELQRMGDWEDDLNGYIRYLGRVPLLLVDDIGIVPLPERKVVFLSALIETRWKDSRSTIFTCNPDDMKTITRDVVSRIKGICSAFTESKGVDYRSVK